MIARRCSKGCANWPDEAEYSVCACCKGLTRRYRSLEPLTIETAESKKKHCEFEDFYATVWTPGATSQVPSIC